jgi:enolase
MSKIKKLIGREILDSRGNPTVEVDVHLTSGQIGRAAVPSGASTGQHEAIELRDNDLSRFGGKGVLNVIDKINNEINNNLVGLTPFDQRKIDKMLIDIDGSNNKSHLGANAVLGVSLAVARAASLDKNSNLFYYLNKKDKYILPTPLMNIINGGAHANNALDFQEIMIMPVGAETFSDALRWGSEIFQQLKKILSDEGYSTSVGDEGGFSPEVNNVHDALYFVSKAVKKAGRNLVDEINLAIDAASSEFFKNGYYIVDGGEKKLNTSEMIRLWETLTKDYPIISIEDPLDENDFEGYSELTKLLGKNIQIVGDDFFATNLKRLQKGIDKGAANSILIKLNQIGTLTETIDAINLAKNNNYGTIISHRSGETEDTFIADLSVAFNTGQIKTGSLSRSERLCKYNQILRIQEELGDKASFNGANILK